MPPFNPLKLMNAGTDVADAPPDPGPVQDNAEVTFRVADLTPADAEQTTGELSQAEAEAQVVETLKAPPAGAQKAAAQSLPPQILLMRTSRAGGDALRALSAYATVDAPSPSTPFASIEVRMIPENVTNAVKASPDDASPSEKLVQIRHGESFEDVLKANGATARRRDGHPRRRSASSAANRRSARGRRSFSCRRSRPLEEKSRA